MLVYTITFCFRLWQSIFYDKPIICWPLLIYRKQPRFISKLASCWLLYGWTDDESVPQVNKIVARPSVECIQPCISCTPINVSPILLIVCPPPNNTLHNKWWSMIVVEDWGSNFTVTTSTSIYIYILQPTLNSVQFSSQYCTVLHGLSIHYVMSRSRHTYGLRRLCYSLPAPRPSHYTWTDEREVLLCNQSKNVRYFW